MKAALARVNWRKVGLFLLSLFLFILAIQLLKSGAKALVPFIREGLSITRWWNALGFGWLFAYGVLSGSPVAATALTFLEAGALDRLGAFGMIAGSRLGASFIVLALGFVYTLRGHDPKRSLAMGLLSLLVTFTVCVPAVGVGYGLLQSRLFDGLRPAVVSEAVSVLDVVFNPIVDLAQTHVPRWAIFGLGFGVLWYSLNLIDHALPNLHLKDSAFGGMARLLYRPLVTFLLGAGITSLTMSVSVSLSLLVPLSARGYIRRENVIPYIMGANITTFVDTLIAGLLVATPEAFSVVAVLMLSVALVSLTILMFAYRPYEQWVLRLTEWAGQSHRHLALFLLVVVGVPIALMLIR
jgi:Na+/phosphate symporter